jgi:hypothetical protein
MSTAASVSKTSPTLTFFERSWDVDLTQKLQQEALIEKTKDAELTKEAKLRKLFNEFDFGISYDDLKQYHASHPDFLKE